MKCHSSTGLLLASALFASACQSVAPEPVSATASVSAPAQWSSPGSAQGITDDWWLIFEDGTLTGIIDEALGANPNLAAAGARVQAASANLAAVSGLDDPQVSAGLNLARRRQNFIGLPIPGAGVASNTSSSHGLNLNASWELDLWGRLDAGERALAANLTASLADVQAARLALASSVAQSYFALVEARGAELIADSIVEIASAALAQTERLQKQGLSSTEALIADRITLQSAKASAAEARQRAAAMEPNLAALLGRSGGSIETAESQLTGKPLAPLPSTGLPADMLRRRPDLAALEAAVQAASAQADVAHAALFPQISLSASAGTSGSELENLLDGDFRVWSLGANILAPLLNGGQLEAQKQSALATGDAALLSFAAGALQAFAEVETALLNEELLATRIAETEQLLWAVTDLAIFTNKHHRQGTGPAAPVFAARISVLNTKRTLLALRTLSNTNRVSLIAALGGGFDVPAAEYTNQSGSE